MVNVETSRSPVPDTGERGPLWTLVVGCLGVALVVGSMVAFNTALGDIAVATSATQTQLNWIVDGYTVVLACLLLPAGAIGDRHGRKLAMLAGLAVFSVASAVPVFVDSPSALIASRMVAGAGAAFVMPATLAVLAQAYPVERRSRAIAIWAAVAGCAGVVGLVGSGILLSFWEWQAICWALALAGVVVFLAAWTISPAPAADRRAVDWIGAALVAAAVAMVVVGLLEAPTRGWMHPGTLAFLAGGLAAGVAFVVVESRRRHPLLDPTLFRDAPMAASAVTITAIFVATFAFFYLGMQYAQLIMGYSALGAGLAFAPFMVPLIGLSLLSFRYTPRWGLKRVLVTGLVVLAVGFVCLLMLEADSGYLTLAVPTVVIGAGIGLCTAPATSTIMSSLRDERQGVASAINDTTRELGAAVGIAVAGSVLAERYTSAITPQLSELPAPLREQIADGFGKAVYVLDSIGPQAAPILTAAEQAFVSAMHTSALVVAGVAAAAALAIAVLIPAASRTERESIG